MARLTQHNHQVCPAYCPLLTAGCPGPCCMEHSSTTKRFRELQKAKKNTGGRSEKKESSLFQKYGPSMNNEEVLQGKKSFYIHQTSVKMFKIFSAVKGGPRPPWLILLKETLFFN